MPPYNLPASAACLSTQFVTCQLRLVVRGSVGCRGQEAAPLPPTAILCWLAALTLFVFDILLRGFLIALDGLFLA